MNIIQNYLNIKNEIQVLDRDVRLVVVSKGQDINKIQLIINQGHLDFGENKVQEATLKWTEILKINKNINLHLIGNLQSNKAKDAFKIFNFIHSLDSEKLAKIFSNLEIIQKKKINYFIQVNIGQELQKGGIAIHLAGEFINYCKNDLKLNILGLMCIPPADQSSEFFFLKLRELNSINQLKYLSMGMSGDFKIAIKSGSNYVRIGSSIFN
jgi:pyridoxal phosphate enzyme (YggS family)